jgi:hypothetical protein
MPPKASYHSRHRSNPEETASICGLRRFAKAYAEDRDVAVLGTIAKLDASEVARRAIDGAPATFRQSRCDIIPVASRAGGEVKMGAFKLRAGLAILVLSWATPGLAETLLRAERPDLKVGDSSVFRDLNVRTGEKRDTSLVVTMTDADKIVNETSGSTSGARTYTRDYNLVEIKTGELVTFTASRNFLEHHVIELVSFKPAP